ncbi:hypothetical protein GCM10010994_33660 [Chelatococcus reniformis]|uniref:Uncharacterized protein n=1 Tax=Chelatococcus reniformis TaxID=1494448 RepID=A0A916UGZ0_9HYPH|nr:hypothetical protein GCM10010994_33660 [Chelatococcus reniformis]
MLLLLVAATSIGMKLDLDHLAVPRDAGVTVEQRLTAASPSQARIEASDAPSCLDVECPRLAPLAYCVVGLRVAHPVTYPRLAEPRCAHQSESPPLRPPRA